MHRHRLPATAVLLSGLLALPLGGQSSPGRPRQVANTSPQWSGNATWRLVPEREVVVSAGSAGELGRPFSPALARDGTLYVLDRDPVGIRVFSRDGTYLRTIGRDGAGPGEFSARALIALHGDTLVVVDRGTQRILFFAPTGRVLSERSIRDLLIDDVLPSESGAPIPVTGRTGANQSGVFWLNGRGEEVARTVLPPVPGAPTLPGCPSMAMPFTPRPMLVAERDGTVIWGRQDAMRFVRSRSGTDTALVFSAPGAAPKVMRADLDRLFGPKGSLARICPSARAGDMPKIKPIWQRIYVDAGANLWVVMTGDPAPAFTVFSRDGILLGRVADPMDPANNRWWFGDQAVEFVTGDDGGTRIRIWRVERTRRP